MFTSSQESGNRTLLVLDNTGDHFRAAVGTGDVDSADHVLVYTPGMSNSVFGDVAAANGEPDTEIRFRLRESGTIFGNSSASTKEKSKYTTEKLGRFFAADRSNFTSRTNSTR